MSHGRKNITKRNDTIYGYFYLNKKQTDKYTGICFVCFKNGFNLYKTNIKMELLFRYSND